jgi:hypothetical protein
MVDGSRKAFLAGERPDDVLVYVAARAVSGIEALADRGERTEKGVAFVLDGERGRRVAEQVLGTDPMDLASAAMDREGELDLVSLAGTCPAAEVDTGVDGASAADDVDDVGADTDIDDGSSAHALRGVFAFAEERNPEAGGIYAEGDVIHAYAVCTCGTVYSDRWVAGNRDPSE